MQRQEEVQNNAELTQNIIQKKAAQIRKSYQDKHLPEDQGKEAYDRFINQCALPHNIINTNEVIAQAEEKELNLFIETCTPTGISNTSIADFKKSAKLNISKTHDWDAGVTLAGLFIKEKIALINLINNEIARIESSKKSFFNRFMSEETYTPKLTSLNSALKTINKATSMKDLDTTIKNILKTPEITQKRYSLGLFDSTTKQNLISFCDNNSYKLK